MTDDQPAAWTRTTGDVQMSLQLYPHRDEPTAVLLTFTRRGDHRERSTQYTVNRRDLIDALQRDDSRIIQVTPHVVLARAGDRCLLEATVAGEPVAVIAARHELRDALTRLDRGPTAE